MATVTERRVLTREPARTKLSRQSLLYHLLVGLASLVMVYPLLWLIGSSLKSSSEIFANMTSPIPRDFTLQNYVSGWSGFGGVTFTRFFLNSFFIAGVSSLGAVLSSAFVAFGFARILFVGKNIWFTLMLLTLMLPIQVQIIPQYIVFNKLGLINTYWPLLLPHFFGQAFFIFLMIQFIRGVPVDLDEAAEIDGASKFGIFFRIILPLLKPALVTAAIFSFYWTWDDFFGPLLYLSDPNRFTVSLALKNFADAQGQTNWGAIFAMSVLSLVPVFALFIAFQKYLVQGISTTGLKG